MTTVTNSAVRRVDGVCVCMRKEDETRFDGIGRVDMYFKRSFSLSLLKT